MMMQDIKPLEVTITLPASPPILPLEVTIQLKKQEDLQEGEEEDEFAIGAPPFTTKADTMNPKRVDELLAQLKHRINNYLKKVATPENPYKPFDFRGYQHKGIKFLWEDCFFKNHGGLIAAEMGLGKSTMALAFFYTFCRSIEAYEELKNPTARRNFYRCIIVAPQTTLYQTWYKEALKCFKASEVHVYHGPNKDSHDNIHRAKRCRVLITTYDQVRSDYDALNNEAKRAKRRTRWNIFRHEWHCLIGDEIQYIQNGVNYDKIKGKTPKRAKAMYALARITSMPIALTGTPSSNRLSDLASIVKFINNGNDVRVKESEKWENKWQDQRTWKALSRIEDPIELGKLVSQLTPKFMFRKSKNDPDVFKLPTLHSFTFPLAMTPSQKAETTELVKQGARLAQEFIHAKQKKPVNGSRMKMMSLFGKMRQICDSPMLIDPDIDLETVSPDEIFQSSIKMQKAVELVETNVVKGKKKQIIFVHYLGTIELLKRLLQSKFPEQRILVIKGDVNLAARDVTLRKFNRPHEYLYNILIMTGKCGGVGIDLTVCQDVIQFGPSFNTTMEDQSISRVHRFGQTKETNIVRFVCDDFSIETHIRNLQIKKMKNVVQVVTPDVQGDQYDYKDGDRPNNFGEVLKFFIAVAKSLDTEDKQAIMKSIRVAAAPPGGLRIETGGEKDLEKKYHMIPLGPKEPAKPVNVKEIARAMKRKMEEDRQQQEEEESDSIPLKKQHL